MNNWNQTTKKHDTTFFHDFEQKNKQKMEPMFPSLYPKLTKFVPQQSEYPRAKVKNITKNKKR